MVDTSGLLAAMDDSQRRHRPALAALQGEAGPFVLSPFVLAELDYLVSTRVGFVAELALLSQVSSGAYDLATFDPDDVRMAAGIVEQYHDQEIGLADASIVVLAHRYRTDRVLTLDTRHFAVLRTIRGGPFRILPGDGPA